MGLRREDLRPLQQLLRAEIASLHAGYGRHFPLAELSLEGNPLEAPILAAVADALRQLSPWPRERETSTTQESKPEAVAPLLRGTQSQPSLVMNMCELSERRALSLWGAKG